MKKLILLLLVIVFSFSAFADIIKLKDAEKVAKSYYYQRVQSFEKKSWDNIKLTNIIKPEDGIYPFYVFDVNNDEGFIIVSSINTIQPVLAYSFEGPFNLNNMSPGQAGYINYYKSEVNYLIQNPISEKDEIIEEWLDLLTYSPSKGVKDVTTVGPLILVKWNQDWPYNADCPSSTTCTGYGANGHVYVGCVATAMVQVMKYYNWPPQGEGSKTHLNFVNGGWGNRTVNFAQQTYDWYSMPFKASGENSELAKINYHAGVAVGMYWGCDGSGSQTQNIVTALKTYFKYKSDVQYVKKSSYSDTNWENLLRAQLNDRKPMVYSGNPVSGGAGHAWNCDGYQGDDKFHMNWGWGGSGNGFYTLTNLTSSATPGGDDYNFINSQDAVINIYPNSDSYPSFCNQSVHLTGHQGAFNDGSANSQYINNGYCTYLIEPECGLLVQLKFESFDLGEGDVINIFDGTNNNGQLINTYSKSNPPSSSLIVAESGAMFIEFITDATDKGDGWDASYTVKFCKNNFIRTAPQGTINDGSGPCNYNNSTVCSWKIQPTNATWISINFTEFDLTTNLDFVKIFKDTQSASNLIVEYNKNNIPTEPLMVESGVAIIQFYSDANTNAGGWTLNYTSSTVSVDQESLKPITRIYPNPSDGNAEISYYSQNANEAIFKISDITGKLIYENTLYSNNNVFHLSLSNALGNNLSDGMYFLEIETENIKTTEKIIISR